MTDTTLCQHHAIQASVRLIQDDPHHYRVEIHWADTGMEVHNRVYSLYSFAVAHKRFMEQVQRVLLVEAAMLGAELEQCRDAFRELWEQDDAGQGQRVREALGAQLAAQ